MVVKDECVELLRTCEQRTIFGRALCEHSLTQYGQTMEAIRASRRILQECDRFLRRNRHLILQEPRGGDESP